MTIRIRNMNRSDKDFYRHFGPVFGSRDVAKQVGVHPYDDEDKNWIAAFDGKRMVGWVSVRGRLVSDCFVVESYRKKGLFAALLKQAVAIHGGRLRAVCTKSSAPAFSKAGFKKTKSSKNFVWMEQSDA
ncbi:MAG: GNAT family N-acetyltransferase [Proteobacteria bacterium]|nr:GNAT family N-acetyltransferase [Pseudomonadota bacterium]